ncbi:maf-like protein DDB_G0281937 isoform X1 [Chenopodium quinoa]|uniref:maf-like protein DDB_G0281937 isoform X1 n=1 Tax=Chenopodium quinoa TaxID=63459 RepID=UPI000B7811C2|nr:maf-like protein DDB_G0281937 isoform X1 [Chenopodium quinoa]XP_021717081.1 maf-like protein DDB_G0281937 isoform X1 [Chenopodium quinoa]
MDSAAPTFKIILGSKSKARREIMVEMGYEFTIMTADIDEKAIRKEKPEDLVMTLAEAKADAVISKLQIADKQVNDNEPTLLIAADTAEATLTNSSNGDLRTDAGPTILITADQVVVYEGMIREKPSGKEEARQYLKDYSGRKASTVSSVLVTNLQTGFRKGEWDRVEIVFDEIPDDTIDKLIEEGAVLHVAGALIIEHPLIKPLVKQVVGTTDSVMGLPKAVTERLIAESL